MTISKSNKAPKVSVCMIAYNVQDYIGEAIEGVLNQVTGYDFDLVISNDNSSDQTEIVINNYLKYHNKGHLIKYFKQESNFGMLPNYLWAFDKCKGQYLSICDSDDYWSDPYKLEKQINFLEENKQFVLSFHDAFMINEVGETIQESIECNLKRDLTFEDWTKDVYALPTASVVFRNDLGLIFPEAYVCGNNHDTFLFILLAQFGDFHFHSNVEPSAYRIHSKGTWSSRSRTGRSLHSLETFQNVVRVFPKVIGFQHLVYKFRNNVIIYSFKERKFVTFLREYPKNFILSFTQIVYFKSFWLLHVKLFIKSK